jgi:hypothetical protein
MQRSAVAETRLPATIRVAGVYTLSPGERKSKTAAGQGWDGWDSWRRGEDVEDGVVNEKGVVRVWGVGCVCVSGGGWGGADCGIRHPPRRRRQLEKCGIQISRRDAPLGSPLPLMPHFGYT